VQVDEDNDEGDKKLGLSLPRFVGQQSKRHGIRQPQRSCQGLLCERVAVELKVRVVEANVELRAAGVALNRGLAR
jgi:hypothetical protein